jgi:hypothetical protein
MTYQTRITSKNTITGIIFLVKFISLWKKVNLKGLSWTMLPNNKFSKFSIWLILKKSKFYNLLRPDNVLRIEAGKYELKIYIVKNKSWTEIKVYWIRYALPIIDRTNTPIIIPQVKITKNL